MAESTKATKSSKAKERLAEFQAKVLKDIPLLVHTGATAFDYDAQSFSLRAPLAPNLNDKGTGFAGSLATLATISGWSLITLFMEDQGRSCDVVIKQSELSYFAPVTGDIKVTASMPEEETVNGFVAHHKVKGRASIRVEVSVYCLASDCEAMRLSGIYTALGAS